MAGIRSPRVGELTLLRSQYEAQYNVKIEFSIESEPLGTAGPLKLAEKILAKDDSPFFVLNSDVICEYPFKQLAEFHKSHGDEGTIVVTKVEEPSKYGVVVHKPNHPSKIDRFVERAGMPVAGHIRDLTAETLLPLLADRLANLERERSIVAHHSRLLAEEALKSSKLVLKALAKKAR